ncbi:pilus assembly PilX family protein [Sedimenticola hydrogenitrophicus]|uniref:pilus assembly PilX family protein n=1 Tax=Sedimenticola hydrogenitrophicus TaxID=2967975 RepID=UPI0023B0B405|nr:PilX N-terminal domain-containing pilus assembly protein [Sedimenticola hydrogenitrophicus]
MAIHYKYTQQGGAVLLVSLIFLILLTILGVSAMQTTLLQERMAGNMRDLNLAFQASEAALRGGEAWLPANTATAEAASELADPAGWDGSGGTSVTGFSPPLASDPVYHVGPPQRVRIGIGLSPPEFRYIYPVTARGVGGTSTTVTVVQSMFEP